MTRLLLALLGAFIFSSCTAGPPEVAKPVVAMILGESAKQRLLTEQVSDRAHDRAEREARAIYEATMHRAADKDGRVSARAATGANQRLSAALVRIAKSRATNDAHAEQLHQNVVDGVNKLMETWRKQGQASEGDVALIRQLGEQLKGVISSKAKASEEAKTDGD